MKITTECVPCLIKRIIFETEQSSDDPEVRAEAVRKACNVLSKIYDPNAVSAKVATKVHSVVYDVLGDDDPYSELKNMSNKVAKELLPYVESIVDKSDDSLKTCMICSIVGNMMDFGIAGGSSSPDDLSEAFDEYFQQGLGYSEYPRLRELIKNSKKILLFTDNCGEIVFDKILVREIKRFNPDMFLTLVVKGESVLSDATIDDALDLGFDKLVDEILTTGCFAVGVDFDKLPEELGKALDEADLIICKGMANYETFSETSYHPIGYLMRTKCKSISESMGVPQGVSVIKVYE